MTVLLASVDDGTHVARLRVLLAEAQIELSRTLAQILNGSLPHAVIGTRARAEAHVAQNRHHLAGRRLTPNTLAAAEAVAHVALLPETVQTAHARHRSLRTRRGGDVARQCRRERTLSAALALAQIHRVEVARVRVTGVHAFTHRTSLAVALAGRQQHLLLVLRVRASAVLVVHGSPHAVHVAHTRSLAVHAADRHRRRTRSHRNLVPRLLRRTPLHRTLILVHSSPLSVGTAEARLCVLRVGHSVRVEARRRSHRVHRGRVEPIERLAHAVRVIDLLPRALLVALARHLASGTRLRRRLAAQRALPSALRTAVASRPIIDLRPLSVRAAQTTHESTATSSTCVASRGRLAPHTLRRTLAVEVLHLAPDARRQTLARQLAAVGTRHLHACVQLRLRPDVVGGAGAVVTGQLPVTHLVALHDRHAEGAALRQLLAHQSVLPAGQLRTLCRSHTNSHLLHRSS